MHPSADRGDEQIAALLRSLVDDDGVRAPNREAIRSGFLAEFDRVRGARANEVVVLELRRDRSHSRRVRSWHVLVPIVAAAVLLAVLGVVALVQVEVDEPVASLPDSTFPSVDLVPIGGELPVGTVVSSLAGGIRFELDEPAVLRDRSDDRITLAFSPDTVEGGLTVSLVATDPGAFRVALSDAMRRGDVRADPAAYRPDSLRLEVTPEGRTAWGCEVGAPCQLDDLSITVAVGDDGVDNFVTTVDLADDRGLVVVERYELPPPPTDPELLDLLGRPEDATIRRRTLAAPIIDSVEPLWGAPGK